MDISYAEIFFYGLKDALGPGAVTVFLMLVFCLDRFASHFKRLFIIGLFFMCGLFAAYILLTTGTFDSLLSRLFWHNVAVASNVSLAVFFIFCGVRNMGQWYRMRRNLQSDVRPFYPGYLLPAGSSPGAWQILLMSVAALGGGVLLVLITSIWAFDYPLFMMFYRLAMKSSGEALPALCIYISGIWLPALLFWLFILMAQSTERLKMFVIRFLSTFKILMAALYLSGGFSVLYLLIIKQ